MDRESRDERHSQGRERGRGSEDALFRLHHQRLVAVVQGRLGVSRELAEDAVAFAWVQLIRTRPEHDSIGGWLYTVAKHEAFALIRAANREQPAEEIESARTAPPPADILGPRKRLALVDRLKPQQRTVLHLRMAGLSYQEICQHTGQTYTWVNRHLTEGRQALRRLIEEEDA
jgi:RNA polymerase sigma factor (sigma-70 family)